MPPRKHSADDRNRGGRKTKASSKRPRSAIPGFHSDGRLPLEAWIAALFEERQLQRQGHAQRVEDLNLGLGWVYYGLGRVLRPRLAVVIGSMRGFVPLILGKAMADNREGGEVWFIDPSMVDDFWKDPARVQSHFARFGVRNVRHFLNTTQQFVETEEYRNLDRVDILFVDGYHTEEQASFDHKAFEGKMAPDGVVLFHDTAGISVSRVYGEGRHYLRTVKRYTDRLKQDPNLQVFDLPFDSGVTLVRRAGPPGPG
jgi:predicted O-methyltransferase YrrM